jgi:hypothetical protein
MRNVMRLALAASMGVAALGGLALHAAKAADMQMPQAQQVPPPEAYGPPPAAYYPPPPPVAYYSYAVPPYVAVPGPYDWRGPYWRAYYGPRVAYGYGRWGWGRGFRR